jgi:hypothetical protein
VKVYSLADAGLMLRDLHGEMLMAAKRGLLSAAHRTVSHVQAQSDLPFDRGVYRAGWRAKPDRDGAIVENLAPHAPFIEFGVRGENVRISRAMIEKLAQWVRRKGIGGTVTKSAKGKGFKKPSTVVATKIAWAIAISMKKKGIFNKGKGLKILDKALKMHAAQFISEEVEKELAKI